jgi:hypothetical protein
MTIFVQDVLSIVDLLLRFQGKNQVIQLIFFMVSLQFTPFLGSEDIMYAFTVQADGVVCQSEN